MKRNRAARWVAVLTILGGMILSPAATRADQTGGTTEGAKKGETLLDRLKESTAKLEEKAKPKDQARVVELKISGAIDEKGVMTGWGGPPPISLRKLLLDLRAIAEDDSIAAVSLIVDNYDGGLAKAEELHAGLLNLRAKKPVHCFMTGAGLLDYYVASACTEITIAPTHWLLINGIGFDMVFFNKMLGKLGIEPQFIQMGKYKSAAESFTRTNISEAARESYQALIDTFFETLAAGIAEGRELEPKAVEALMSAGPFTAEQELAMGLVDWVEGEPAYYERIEAAAGKTLKIDDEYGKEENPFETDNPFALFQIFMGTEKKEDVEENTIALVYFTGPVVDGPPQEAAYEDEMISAYPLVGLLEELKDEENVVAVVVRVDSGGGSAFASDQIWSAMRRLRAEKPVVVTMSDVAGSGGYYVAMAGHYIYADAMTITGSIGVISGKFVLAGLYDWAGLDHDSVSRGRTLKLFDTTRPWNTEEITTWRKLMETIYKDFVGKAAEDRGMEYEAVHDVAQGRVWTGRDAVKIGLIDEVGGLFDAVDKAKELAGLNVDEKYPLEVYPKKLSPFEMLNRIFGFGASGASSSKVMTPRAAAAAIRQSLGPAGALLPNHVVEQAGLLFTLLQQDGVALTMPAAISLN